MHDEVIVQGNIAYLPGAEATVFMDKHSGPSKEPTRVQLPNQHMGTRWSNWGEDNLFPQNVTEIVSKNPVAMSALNFKIKAHYGKGPMVYKLDYDQNGKEVIRPQKTKDYPELHTFFKDNKIKKYLLESITDHVWFYNVFPEMIVSLDFSKITSIRSQEATYCRWEVMNEETNRIENCYISANWPNPTDAQYSVVPVIDPYWTTDQVRDYLARHKIYKFIYPAYYPTPGKSYYQLPYWDGARASGWIDVANAVPDFKKNMLKNQMTLKYHIKIPFEHWRNKYKDWDSFTSKKQEDLIKKGMEEMDDFLKDTKNTAKSFMSHFAIDEFTKKTLPGWEIVPIDNKLKDGLYLPDSQAANSETLFAMQVDPSLIGHGLPGGKLGAGSGSDKRIAFQIHNALLGTDRDVTFEPIEFIRDYNGWDDELLFGHPDIMLTTLEENPTGTEKVKT